MDLLHQPKFLSYQSYVNKYGLRQHYNPRFGMSGKHMPDKCPDCNRTMTAVIYDNMHWGHLSGSASSRRSYRECECGCLIVWEYPNVFVRHHILPLFDTDKQILGEA